MTTEEMSPIQSVPRVGARLQYFGTDEQYHPLVVREIDGNILHLTWGDDNKYHKNGEQSIIIFRHNDGFNQRIFSEAS